MFTRCFARLLQHFYKVFCNEFCTFFYIMFTRCFARFLDHAYKVFYKAPRTFLQGLLQGFYNMF